MFCSCCIHHELCIPPTTESRPTPALLHATGASLHGSRKPSSDLKPRVISVAIRWRLFSINFLLQNRASLSAKPWWLKPQGHCHFILGILDHGSRMALALIPLSNRRSLTLLKWLIATIETHGRPKIIRTDNQTYLTSRQFTLALRLLNLRHLRTQPGHPWPDTVT